MLLCGYNSIQLKKPIRHERDAILNEIKTYMSKINLQRGKLTVENRKSREKKRICSEVSVNSPGNPWSQSRRGKGRLWWEGFVEKESFQPRVKE